MSIWQNIELDQKYSIEKKITLSEGYTPLSKITYSGIDIWIKREDYNPSKSFKDRGTALKLSELMSEGINEAVISSSGNAAISYLTYANNNNFNMHIVVSPNTNSSKLKLIKELIKEGNHQLYIESKARNFAAKISAQKAIPNLRASTDGSIINAYQTIGDEIKGRQFTDVFIPTSSGTGLVGMAQGLDLNVTSVHACQTAKVNPISSEFDKDFKVEESSLATSIVDNKSLRKPQVLKIIKESSGSGWTLENADIKHALEIAGRQLEENVSDTSALALAGAIKAIDKNSTGMKIVVIATGL